MTRGMVCRLVIAALALCAGGPALGQGEGPRRLTEDDLRPLAWRSIGPANMAGRVAAIAVAPHDAKTWYIGYATGGVWKTTNNGVTYAPIFDREETACIGAIAVADAPTDWAGWDEIDAESDEPVDRDEAGKGRIVWVGTGEGNGRNSSSWGNGVYRSTDGGGSWEHKGLADSHDIPAIAVDPRDPDVCYIGALGRLWGANDMRGVYKTTDGGETWTPSLRIDAHTGACDVLVDPKNPDTVYAAMYARRRTAWSYQSGGPEGGVYKSTDGGATWRKLTEGLPAQTGRIGLDIYRDDPRILMAIIESDEGGKFASPWNNHSRAGGVFRSADGGETWARVSDYAPRSFYFSRIRIDPNDDQRVYLLGWQVSVSDDGGDTFRKGFNGTCHVDNHAMWINPEDTDHLLIGNDGGVYVSWDRGKTWDFQNHMAVGQFYNVSVDDSDPYRVGGGLQDNGTWIGTAESLFRAEGGFMGRAGAITNADWRFVSGGDGFHLAYDPIDPNIIFSEAQGGAIVRVHLDTGVTRNIKPSPKEGEPRFRFNWNAPFFISEHDPNTLYIGGNSVFRLTDRGERWQRVSPDLTSNDVERVVSEGSEAETYGTIVSLVESPRREGLLWAGTDDGFVHITRDGGASWTDVTPAAVGGMYIASIAAGAHDIETAYVAVDGHRSNVFEPILLRTADGGATWDSIVGDLPTTAPVDVILEDPTNPDVLYLGTEQAAYVTITRGAHWVKLNGKTLPTVRVDDLKMQRREMDLVAGTHGRSIWVLDDASPLGQLTPEILEQPLHVFEPIAARPRYYGPKGGLWSDQMFIANNAPAGAALTYWLRDHSRDDVKIEVKDASGHVLWSTTGPNDAGLNRVVWDLQADKAQRLGDPHKLPEFVPAGAYTVSVKHGEASGKATLRVHEAPSID